MEKVLLSREDAIIGLRAMREVARADGHETESEDLLLDCAASALGLDVKHEDLAPIDEEEVGRAIADATKRERLVQAMVVMAVADGEVTEPEAKIVRRYAKALGVDDARVKNLEQIVEGHFLRLRIDVLRRFPVVREMAASTVKNRGLFGLAKTVAILRGFARDEAIAWRFKKLGLLPAGTLGRELWAHMTENELSMPGEPHGFNEYAVHHDFTHVIGGYDVTAAGEIQVAAFTAGMKKTDAFALVFATILSFHLGLRIHPVAEPSRGNFDIARTLHAFERGMCSRRDLTVDWDYWKDVEKPLATLRAELGIPPA
jgi:uncharacterized tellurite resistance protein B-like protein